MSPTTPALRDASQTTVISARPPRARTRRRASPGLRDPTIGALAAARLLASTGVGAYSTVLLLYLVRFEHLGAPQAGLALTGAGLAALAASPAAGRLADRGHAARFGAAALLTQGAAAAAIALPGGGLLRFTALACLYALANQTQLAVRGALVAALVPPGGEAPLVARLRTVGNIGVSLGIPLAGLALAAGTAHAARACLLAAAACYAVAAALMTRVSARPAPARHTATPAAGPGPLTDRRFVAFTLVTAVQSLQFPLLEFAVPLWILTTRAPRWTVAAAGLANAAVVIALQVAATRRVTQQRRAARVPIGAGLLVGGACAALGAAEGPGAPAAIALLALAVLALSLAEVGQVAAGDALSFALTPTRSSHGAYQGLFTVAPGLAQTAGPALLAAVMLPHGRAGWLAAGALFALAGPLTPAALRLRPRPAATPTPPESAVHVLAATRRPVDRYPIAHWIDPKHAVTLLGSAEHPARAVGARTVLIRDYTTSARFDLEIIDAHRARRIDRLLIFSEYDVWRAARLRRQLGIRGQHPDSARAYRDKAVMKRRWAKAGVPAAEHTAIGAPGDLLDFAVRTGYPIVVKPRAGMGSAGVAVLDDEQAARAWLIKHFIHADGQASAWIAEAFVDGTMLQVDGVYHGARGIEVNWPTRVSSLLACFDGQPVTSITLGAEDPLVPRAQDLVAAALAALPDPDGPIVFHAEVWVDARGQVMMNEVAARIGGGQTRQIIETACGVDLVRHYVEASVDPHAHPRPAARRPLQMVGELAIPPGHGRLREHPPLPAALADAPWMKRAAITGAAGTVYRGPATSVDSIAEFLVTGTSPGQVAQRLSLITDWCHKHLHYDDPQPDTPAPEVRGALAAA